MIIRVDTEQLKAVMEDMLEYRKACAEKPYLDTQELCDKHNNEGQIDMVEAILAGDYAPLLPKGD